MNSFKSGAQVHAVPEDERAVDSRGQPLPWGYSYADELVIVYTCCPALHNKPNCSLVMSPVQVGNKRWKKALLESQQIAGSCLEAERPQHRQKKTLSEWKTCKP